MTYPVTTEESDHPGGYEAALVRVLRRAGPTTLGGHLDAGRDVAVLCEGDPMFYGSYIYLHERLSPRYTAIVVPGVTSLSAASASAGVPLARRDEILTVLPGTLPPDVLATRLSTTDAAVVMKLGRTFAKVREAAGRAGVDGRAVYVERASSARERTAGLADVDPADVPYMSLVLVPGDEPSARGRGGQPRHRGPRPRGPEWLTPEAQAALARAEVLVGYGTYLARVPPRRGQERRASDNRAELERARDALELALGGARVAVVSSGDPGIFAMAAAVYEAIEGDRERFAAVPVRVVPGVSAMQVAAARAGAPLGHDFCVISLSDQLKPWAVIERRLEAAACGRLRAGALQPGLTFPPRAARARARGAAAPPRRRDARRASPAPSGATRSPDDHHAGDVRRGRRRHADDPPGRLIAHARDPGARVFTPRDYPG